MVVYIFKMITNCLILMNVNKIVLSFAGLCWAGMTCRPHYVGLLLYSQRRSNKEFNS